MTDPQHVTAAQAADPTVPLQLLADVVAQRPDLRAVVAGNPATYPALLDWLGSLGDADVDAALRARRAAFADAGAPDGGRDTRPGPTGTPSSTRSGASVSSRIAEYGALPGSGGSAVLGPSGDPGPDRAISAAVPAATVQPAEPGTGFSPLGATGTTVAEPASPYLPVPRPAPYTQPDGVYYPPPSTTGYPSFSTAPGYPPAGPTSGYPAPGHGAPAPWQTPKKSSNRALWIALAVIGVLVAAVIAVVIAIAVQAGTGGSYGADPVLDALHDACAVGDMQACDELYQDSPFGSEYEEFGATCGGRTDWWPFCTEDDLGG